MILAIPTKEMNGFESVVYGHFGSAPFYAYYDSSSEKLDFTDNSGKDHEHGQCQPVAELTQKKVEAVVCGGMGLRAIQNLNNLGIKVYLADQALSVTDIVNRFKTGEIKEMLPANACQHHDCH